MVEIGYVRDSVPVQKKKRLEGRPEGSTWERGELKSTRTLPCIIPIKKTRNKSIELLSFWSLSRKITSFNWRHLIQGQCNCILEDQQSHCKVLTALVFQNHIEVHRHCKVNLFKSMFDNLQDQSFVYKQQNVFLMTVCLKVT